MLDYPAGGDVTPLYVTSSWFHEQMKTQEITLLERIHPGIVDCRRVIEIARKLAGFLNTLVLKVERRKVS